ncbi:hypothetical protein D3C72_1557510 [compost metagenome]
MIVWIDVGNRVGIVDISLVIDVVGLLALPARGDVQGILTPGSEQAVVVAGGRKKVNDEGWRTEAARQRRFRGGADSREIAVKDITPVRLLLGAALHVAVKLEISCRVIC